MRVAGKPIYAALYTILLGVIMSIQLSQTQQIYGIGSPIQNNFPFPQGLARALTTSDQGLIGQVVVALGVPYMMTAYGSGATAGQYIWTQLETSGGGGVFSSLTVTPGPISLTGTTTINTSGSAVTTIGTGGTGVVNIGNATGNVAVTGTLTSTVGLTAGTSVVAGTGITATTGNISAVTGSIQALANNVYGQMIVAEGDAGSGTSSETALTNVSVPVAGGTGAFTITSATTSGAATNAGFIKMYVGTTAVFVPYYTTTA